MRKGKQHMPSLSSNASTMTLEVITQHMVHIHLQALLLTISSQRKPPQVPPTGAVNRVSEKWLARRW